MIESLAEMYVPVRPAGEACFSIGVWAVLQDAVCRFSRVMRGSVLTFWDLPASFITRPDRATAGFSVLRSFRARARALCALREPKLMVTIGGYAQGVTIPVIAWAALYLRYFKTDKRITPTLLSDIFLWLAVISITAVAGYALVTDIVPSLFKLFAASP
jgi:hypothetical protein